MVTIFIFKHRISGSNELVTVQVKAEAYDELFLQVNGIELSHFRPEVAIELYQAAEAEYHIHGIEAAEARIRA